MVAVAFWEALAMFHFSVVVDIVSCSSGLLVMGLLIAVVSFSRSIKLFWAHGIRMHASTINIKVIQQIMRIGILFTFQCYYYYYDDYSSTQYR